MKITKNQKHDQCRCEIRTVDPINHHSYELFCLDHNVQIQWLSVEGKIALEQLGIPHNKSESVIRKFRNKNHYNWVNQKEFGL